MPTVITGTDGINQVQAGAVESGDLASGAIGSGDLPAGSVIQVVHTLVRPNVVTSSSSPITIGLSTSITPTKSNSMFVCIVTIHSEFETDPSGYGLVFFRDNSEIRSPGNYYEVYFGRASQRQKSSFQFLDTPNTTNTVTYDFRPELFAGTMKFGDGLFDCNATIMEIAG